MENKTTQPFFIIFVLAFLFVFSSLGKAQKASYNLIQKEDITFFKGDSLNGFPLDEELNKCKQLAYKRGELFEYKNVLKQKEAGFVKKKYNIGKLPYEIAFEQEVQRNEKSVITESQKQAYRLKTPPPQTLA